MGPNIEKYIGNSLKYSYIIISSIFLLVIIFSSGLNHIGLKYSISKDNIDNCHKAVYLKAVTESFLCCDNHYHNHDWVCVAANDKLTHFIASSNAFWLPLIPWVITFISDHYFDYKNHSYLLSFRRLLFYIGIIALRTVSLRLTLTNTFLNVFIADIIQIM